MTRQEAQARSIRRWTKEAISLAMHGEWERAVAINKAILEFSPTDVDAYNRLGRALMELGEYAQAREAYTHALEIDADNSIAQKNLSRLSYVKEPLLIPKGSRHKISCDTFIEETTKSGVISLKQLASDEALARLATGEEVYLQVKGQQLVVENGEGEYLGRVEPRHELHLIKLIEGGNSYTVAIASIKEDEVKVIIREIYQHPNQAGILSFAPRGGYPQLVYAEEQQSNSPFEGGGFSEEKDLPLEANLGEISQAEEEIDGTPENHGFSSGSNLSE